MLYRVRSELRNAHRNRHGQEIHQKQRRLRDRCRTTPISLGSSKALCQAVGPTDRESKAELQPVEMPTEGRETSVDVSGSGTVPEVEVEEAVGFESEEPVNV